MSMQVLGIDPGLNTTGYAVVEFQGSKPTVAEAGVIRPGRASCLERRLARLFGDLQELLATWQPCALALEDLFTHYRRPRTAILMGHARGVICLAAAQAGVPVVAYPPAVVKKLITGHGRAGKEQMQQAVALQLGLSRPPAPADVADALALALCHGISLRRSALAG